MRRILYALAVLLLASPAYAQQTKSALTTEINTNFADNNVGAITPALLRSTITDLVNSYVDYNGASTFTCTGSKWVSSGSLSAFTCTQPAFTDISGTLGLSGGGTNANLTASAGGIVYSTASAFAILPGTAVASQCLLSGSNAPPTWGSCPGGGGGSGIVNAGTTGQLTYYAASGTTVSGLATGNISSSPTFLGNVTFAPTSGAAITATGASSSLSRVLDTTQTAAGTAGANQQLNQISITDVANLGTFTGNGLNISLNYGGSTSQGNRQAIQAGVTLTSATNASNATHFYVGGQFNAQANSADNGTNTGAGAKGSLIGINPACTLGASATNIAECAGIEVTVQTASGSTLSERSGLQISDISGAGGSQGATFDAAITMGNTASSPGWKSGIAFDATNYASAPLDATNGRAIEFIGAQNVKDILYAPSVTPSNSYITFGSNMVVDPNGNTQIKSTSSFGWLGSFSRIFSPGNGVMELTDSTASTFGRLQFGGTTSSFPAIKRNAAAINFRLADDSADAAITASLGTFIENSIGTSSTDGLVLSNSTAAGAGAQQFSPRLRLTGQGWSTNGGGSSKTVDWMLENRPVQGTADPSATLVISQQINGGGYTPNAAFVFGPLAGSPAAPADSTQRFISIKNSLASATYGADAGGLVYAWCTTCAGTLFGTQNSAPTDFWTNNVRRVRIDQAATHISFWNNTTGAQTGNTPPVLTSCGTGPAISSISSDASGTVTMGTGSPTGCVITFAVAYVNTPVCRVTWRVNIASMQYAVSTTAITLTQTGTSSNVVDYSCDGS